MSKKLNIIEAMKMPIGTEFEVILNGEEFGCVAKILKSNVQSKKQLVWDNRANTSIFITDSIADAVFTKIQQPVSFMEAIANDKNRVKVILNDEHFCSSDVKALNNYMSIRELFEEFNKRFSDYGIVRAINEGKWYIEESEADSNE